MQYFAHPTAIVESESIGPRTTIWAFCHVLPGARIGADCNLCDHTFLENDVTIGDRVTIKSGVQLWNATEVEDDVFIGPNATFTNDPFPRSKQRPACFARTLLRKGCSIGANATILPGIEIGQCAMVGAGAVVTHNVPPHAIVAGNPARITGYCTTEPAPKDEKLHPAETVGEIASVVAGVTLHGLPRVEDLRGSLSFGEVSRHIPFEVRRYFLIFGVSNKEIRGQHAHRDLHQFLICVHGTCRVLADDGEKRQEFVLDRPDAGLHVRPMTWLVHYHYTEDAVLLVLASDFYDPDDYIRDYGEYLALRRAGA